jgi:chemosensory pili system protein ChpA (sensor histidine kinase/response regulator)
VLPLTTAVTHVVMVRAGTMTVGVPSNLVEVVLRVTADELDAGYVAQHHRFDGEDVPLYWAGALLQSSARSEQPDARGHAIAIVRSASQRLALHVDEVLGNQEVVVKNLGPQLSRLPGIAAVSVLASGAVSLIYNPVALAAVHGEAAREWQRAAMAQWAQEGDSPGAAALPAEAPLVLVVDDSITVRRVTQRLLQREGFRVALAIDGLQALERLQQERPAVVLSDIEMPRMDGFDLVRNIRADTDLAGLPVIMITSRIAAKHRELAMELGVDHYLGKPYSEDELVRLVRSCIRVTSAAS